MQILKQNFNLKEIILKHAKFQKVLLCYDESVSSLNVAKIYNEIKELCIFNKMEIDKFNTQEIYDGYKLIIFYCSANNFLKLNINLTEFVNVFIPTDADILPFFLNENFMLNDNDNYLFLPTNQLDINIVFSVYFNKFYNYLKDLLLKQESEITFDFNLNEITQLKTLELLKQNNLEFIDVKILNKTGLDYCNLPTVDILLLLAFLLLVCCVHENRLCLVDIYKSMKDNYQQIDKFYSLANNCVFNQLVNVNFISLKNVLTTTINKLKNFFTFKEIEPEIFEKLKNFCKNEDNLLNYLYLYNIFGE